MFVLEFDAALLTLNTKAPFCVPLSQFPEAVKSRPKNISLARPAGFLLLIEFQKSAKYFASFIDVSHPISQPAV